MEQMAVGAYGRISEDLEETGLGVQRQLHDGKSIAAMRGWTITEEYVDNDLSAFKRKVVRPEFERMLEDLRSGTIQGVVVYDLDRFARQPRDLERAIEIYEDKPGLVFASVQGDINLQTPDGKTMARVMVAFANKASMDTGRRVARKHLENARTGKPVGGYRPFGWKKDKATLDHKEAALVRSAVEGILAGASLRSVMREWNDAGVTTSTGREWKLPTLRQYLKSPRLVGHRTHQGKVLLDEQGRPVEGLWEPMVDVDTYDRLQLLLTKPEGRVRVPRRNARHYLMTGLLRCGVCRGPMYGNRYAEGKFYYVCHAEGGNKHTLTISGNGTDEAVRDLVVRQLQRMGSVAPPETAWDGEGDLAETQQQIDELMAAFDAKQLSANLVFPRVQALQERVAEMRESRSAWLLATMGPAPRSITTEEWDDSDDMDWRRGLVEDVLIGMVVLRPTRRGNRFDDDRLEPMWNETFARRAALSVLS